MAKLHTGTNMSLVSQLNLDKIMARQPTQKQILGHNLGFISFSYKLFKKQKKYDLWITKKTYPLYGISGLAMTGKIMAHMGPDGATTSHDAVLTYNGYGASSYVVSSLVAYIMFFAIRYSSFINTKALVMLVTSAMISRYITCYAVVVATTVFIFLKLLRIPKFLLHYVSAIKYPFEELLRDITKCVKRCRTSFSKLHNTTSAAQNWRLIDEDVLSSVDVYSIEGFCVSLGFLLVCRVVYLLFFYVVRRFYCKNDRN